MGVKQTIIRVLLLLLVVLIPTFIYTLFYIYNIGSDIQPHTSFMVKRNVPANFLYYYSVIIFSGFSKNYELLFKISLVVLILSVVFKYLVSFKIAELCFYNTEKLKKHSTLIRFILLLSLIAGSINGFDLWSLTINLWYNSTTIFVMPFVVLLFYNSYKYILLSSKKNLILILVFSIIAILIKPNFVFTVIPIFMLFVFIKYKFSNVFWRAFGVSSLILLILFLSYLGLFVFEKDISNSMERGIGIGFFKVWRYSRENIILDLFAGIAFPLLLIILYFKTLKTNLLLKYTWSVFGLAMLVYITFYEKTDLGAGNFIWQVVMSNYILFTVSGLLFLELLINKYEDIKIKLSVKYYYSYFKNKKLIYKDFIIMSVFILHILGGLLYIYLYYAQKIFQ